MPAELTEEVTLAGSRHLHHLLAKMVESPKDFTD